MGTLLTQDALFLFDKLITYNKQTLNSSCWFMTDGVLSVEHSVNCESLHIIISRLVTDTLSRFFSCFFFLVTFPLFTCRWSPGVSGRHKSYRDSLSCIIAWRVGPFGQMAIFEPRWECYSAQITSPFLYAAKKNEFCSGHFQPAPGSMFCQLLWLSCFSFK